MTEPNPDCAQFRINVLHLLFNFLIHQDLNPFTFSAPMHSFQLPCYNFLSPYNTLPWYESCLCNCIPFIKHIIDMFMKYLPIALLYFLATLLWLEPQVISRSLVLAPIFFPRRRNKRHQKVKWLALELMMQELRFNLLDNRQLFSIQHVLGSGA